MGLKRPNVRLQMAPQAGNNLTAATIRDRGRPWMRKREQVLKSAFGLCAACKCIGRVAQAQEVDHVVPLADGGSDDIANLQALCTACHEAKSAGEARARAGGASKV